MSSRATSAVSRRRLAAAFAGIVLLVAACGRSPEAAPRLAVEPAHEASGPLDSPAVQAAFKIQAALDTPVAQATMRFYLGRRYAGDWIVNNGKRGVLYIGEVGPTATDQAYARRHIHMGPHASFRLVDEKYSMSQLERFQSVIEKDMKRIGTPKILRVHPFVSIGVSPSNNAVIVGVPEKDAGYWLPKLQPLLPYDALAVQYGPVAVADRSLRR
jgi:hypothetical protein